MEVDDSELPLLIALDVGLKNLSLCALRVSARAPRAPDSATEAKKRPCKGKKRALRLEAAKLRLAGAQLVSWEVVALGVTSSDSFADRAAAVARFIQERKELFQNAQQVIVEHQMQCIMRSVAAALFACIRMVNDTVPLCFQQSKLKLAWEDIAGVLAASQGMGPLRSATGYAARKKAAVGCACYLLDLSTLALTKRRREAVCQHAPLSAGDCRGDMRRIFLQSTKRDDLADALLHLLAH